MNVLSSVKPRLRSLLASAALGAVGDEAKRYARARKRAKSEEPVDADTYARVYGLARDTFSLALANAMRDLEVRHMATNERIRLASPVRDALALGASIDDVETRLTELHPRDRREVIDFAGEPHKLGWLRIAAEFCREWQRLLRWHDAGDPLARFARRHAARAGLALIQALAEARSAEIDASGIAAALSSLEPQDAEHVLAVKGEDWPAMRIARARGELKDRSDATAQWVLDEMPWLGS